MRNRFESAHPELLLRIVAVIRTRATRALALSSCSEAPALESLRRPAPSEVAYVERRRLAIICLTPFALIGAWGSYINLSNLGWWIVGPGGGLSLVVTVVATLGTAAPRAARSPRAFATTVLAPWALATGCGLACHQILRVDDAFRRSGDIVGVPWATYPALQQAVDT